jgi:phospholipase/carboxylesterase
MAELDGPRIEPRSGRAHQLVVFLHGYGADGNDLIEIGRAWQDLPDASFVSPHAALVRTGTDRRMVSAHLPQSG